MNPLTDIKEQIRDEYDPNYSTAEIIDIIIDRTALAVLDMVEGQLPPCQTFGCDGQGTIANQVGENEWEPEPCQYCHEIRLPFLSRLQALRQEICG